VAAQAVAAGRKGAAIGEAMHEARVHAVRRGMAEDTAF
jgi:hypothetical protein